MRVLSGKHLTFNTGTYGEALRTAVEALCVPAGILGISRLQVLGCSIGEGAGGLGVGVRVLSGKHLAFNTGTYDEALRTAVEALCVSACFSLICGLQGSGCRIGAGAGWLGMQ